MWTNGSYATPSTPIIGQNRVFTRRNPHLVPSHRLWVANQTNDQTNDRSPERRLRELVTSPLKRLKMGDVCSSEREVGDFLTGGGGKQVCVCMPRRWFLYRLHAPFTPKSVKIVWEGCSNWKRHEECHGNLWLGANATRSGWDPSYQDSDKCIMSNLQRKKTDRNSDPDKFSLAAPQQ